MKKIVALLLVGSIALAGCGKADEEKSSTSTEVEQTSSASREATPTPTEEAKSEVETESVTEISEVAKKEERNGYSEGTTPYTCSWVTFNVPNYFKSSFSKSSSAGYVSSSEDDSVASLVFSEVPLSQAVTKDNAKDAINEAMTNLLNSINLSVNDVSEFNSKTYSDNIVIEFKTAAAIDSSDYPSMTTVDITGDLIFKENESHCVGSLLMVGNNSKYLYDTDYENILSNMTVDYTNYSSESSSSSSTTDSSQVTPELKEFLDSYEAFVDQYIEFINQYKANPTDATLIQQYSDYLTKLSDFEKKANEYQSQEGQMSTADYNYYIDVTTRCSQKLLKASASLSQ